MPFAVFGGSTESDDVLGKNSGKQLKVGTLSGWRQIGEDGRERNDLLDNVIRRGADFTVRFVENGGASARCSVLAALFDQGKKG